MSRVDHEVGLVKPPRALNRAVIPLFPALPTPPLKLPTRYMNVPSNAAPKKPVALGLLDDTSKVDQSAGLPKAFAPALLATPASPASPPSARPASPGAPA